MLTDDDVINLFVDKKRNKIYESRVNLKFLTNSAPEYKTYLDNRYTEPFRCYSEVIARIYHHIETKPVCKICGNNLKFISFKTPYRKWCCQKCQLTDPDFIRWRSEIIDHTKSHVKARKTKLERYGDENFNNREKAIQTSINKYGVSHALKLQSHFNKVKQTKLERYGDENYCNVDKIKQTKLERYGDENYVNFSKARETMKERYGVEYTCQSEELYNKVKQTNLERYGVEIPTQSADVQKKARQTNIERYGANNYTQTDEYKKIMKIKHPEQIKKVYETKKAHGTFNTSSIEQQFKKYLDEHNIDYKYQYKSENYPFVCDFYFPGKDLYLEIQGHWTHGGHPYNPDSKEDKKVVEMWRTKNTKFYKIAEKVWTVRDPQKRQWVKEHNLNWKEAFTYKLNDLLRELQLLEDKSV